MTRRAAGLIEAFALATALAAITGCEALFPLGGLGPSQGDGGKDGETAGDGPSTCDAGYCACLSPPPKFCDDFERSDAVGQWSDESGSPAIAEAGVGHGKALHVALDGNSTKADYLTKTFQGSVTAVRYAFDLRIRTAGSGNCAGISILLPPSYDQSLQA